MTEPNGGSESESDPQAPVDAPSTPPTGFPGARSTPPPGFAPVPPPRAITGADLYGTPGHARTPMPVPATPPPHQPQDRPPSSPNRTILLIGLVVVVVIGIGGGFLLLRNRSSQNELTKQGTPGAAIEEYRKVLLDGDATGACEMLSKRARRTLPDGSCAEGYGTLIAFTKFNDGQRLDVEAVAVDGNRATVTLSTGTPVALVWERGTWKIDQGPTEAPHKPTTLAEQCEESRTTLSDGIEAYKALFGKAPADTDALIEAHLLGQVPMGARVAPDGTVTMTGDCA